MKTILILFELILGLKVNFHKSELKRVNVYPAWLNDVVDVLNCKVGCLTMKYLGLPIGADPKRIHTWESVINLVRKRLSSRKNLAIYMGDCLVLLNIVLTAFSIYFLLFFKASSCIIFLMESLFKIILGGVGETEKNTLD
jgi:hypothetical protein